MQRTQTSFLLFALLAAACPGPDLDTTSSTSADPTDPATNTGASVSASSTSVEPGVTTGSVSDTAETTTGPGDDSTTGILTSGPATETATGAESTGSPEICHLNQCETDSDCDAGAVCFPAVEALAPVKVCSIPCQHTSDCGNACADAPISVCSNQGICEPLPCRVGVDDCMCAPWINSVMVCM